MAARHQHLRHLSRRQVRACCFSARQRAAPCEGNRGFSFSTVSRYSQITGLSNSASPSSVTRHGTLDSGLAASRSGGEAWGLMVTRSICPSMPRAIAQASTLRTYGLVGE